MVMENLLFGRNILRRYDLKGALFSRYVADSKNPESVLLDQNFIEDMRTMPIYIEGKTKNLMERAIWNDTSFLCVSMLVPGNSFLSSIYASVFFL
jgi:1-phosphatidylinositol-3-phosphate 5-kinase